MDRKIFKTLDEQVDLLKEKGLIVNDQEYAKEVLLRENYFFLNGYRHAFFASGGSKRYIKGTTFEELYSVFLFDRKIRNIFFRNLLIIENNLKSIFAYQLSQKYGYKEKDYLNPKNFTNDPMKSRQVNDLLNKMKRQVRINTKQHTATMHYLNNYGYIPLWVLVKVLSFGIVCEMFSILKNDDRLAIAGIYNIDSNQFEEYLPILANYRNVCAHEDILYETRTQRVIENTMYHVILGISKMDGEYIYGKNDLFALLIILRQLLKNNEYNDLIIEISHCVEELEYNLKTIDVAKVLDRMGFPNNWKEINNIKKRD